MFTLIEGGGSRKVDQFRRRMYRGPTKSLEQLKKVNVKVQVRHISKTRGPGSIYYFSFIRGRNNERRTTNES